MFQVAKKIKIGPLDEGPVLDAAVAELGAPERQTA